MFQIYYKIKFKKNKEKKMEYVIETKNLVKRYKNRLAINKINMHVKKAPSMALSAKMGLVKQLQCAQYLV